MAIVVNNLRSGAKFTQSVPPLNPKQNDVWYNIVFQTYFIYNIDIWETLFTDSAPMPGPGSEYSYTCGGYSTPTSTISNIQRMHFPFNSGVFETKGNLVIDTCEAVGCNSSQTGYIMNGHESTVTSSNIEKISFPFDSGDSVISGNTTISSYLRAGFNSSRYGYSSGGFQSGYKSLIERFAFPFDSGTAVNVGNLSSSKYIGCGYNSSQHGFAPGGMMYDGNHYYYSSIDRIEFPFDSGTATKQGNLNSVKYLASCCNSSTDGFLFSGRDSSAYRQADIEKTTFPFDSGNTAVVSYHRSTVQSAASNSTIHGFIAGGYDQADYEVSIVQRITFPFDSGVVEETGTLVSNMNQVTGIDGTDFSTLFV